MSLRSIWIVSLKKEDFGEIIFYRTFPTVERRAKLLFGEKYVRLPSPSIIVNSLLIKLGLSVSSKQFIEWRDKPNKEIQLPVVDLKVGGDEVWPVVSVTQQSLLVCCLPFVDEDKAENKESLIKLPSVSIGFSVILGILNFLEMKSNDERESQLIDLDNFLTLSMPFGTPSDMALSCTSYVQYVHSQNFPKRQPAWKPVDYKGKQQIHIKISEFVRCMQSEQNRSICHYEVFGQISVKADLEGSLNDVTVSVTSSDASRSLSLDSILLHPCVQMHGTKAATSGINLRRLRFSPPLQEFILMQYCSPELIEPPIQGVFKMLGESSIELLIQLKLSAKVKNNFDYFDVIVVFFNRGPVKNLEFNTNHGSPKLSEDKHSLKWNIGTKFPKDLEVALTAKLSFREEPVLPKSDPFCINKNCYAQINFKQNNSTLSGCNIDQKSVIVSQTSKTKIAIEKSVQSIEYRLWNSYGDLPFPVDIINKYDNLYQ